MNFLKKLKTFLAVFIIFCFLISPSFTIVAADNERDSDSSYIETSSQIDKEEQTKEDNNVVFSVLLIGAALSVFAVYSKDHI